MDSLIILLIAAVSTIVLLLIASVLLFVGCGVAARIVKTVTLKGFEITTKDKQKTFVTNLKNVKYDSFCQATVELNVDTLNAMANGGFVSTEYKVVETESKISKEFVVDFLTMGVFINKHGLFKAINKF